MASGNRRADKPNGVSFMQLWPKNLIFEKCRQPIDTSMLAAIFVTAAIVMYRLNANRRGGGQILHAVVDEQNLNQPSMWVSS